MDVPLVQQANKSLVAGGQMGHPEVLENTVGFLASTASVVAGGGKDTLHQDDSELEEKYT